MTKRYGYMIKTVFEKRKRLYGYGKFKYPKKKGAKVVALDWNSRDVCYGGIFGLVHHTQGHYINNRECWMILKYEIGTEVVVSDSKIKVPWALIEAWGSAEEMQRKFEGFTGKEYVYNYRVVVKGNDVNLRGGASSVLEAGDRSVLTAGSRSSLMVGDGSKLKSRYSSTMKAGTYSVIEAGDLNTLVSGGYSKLTAGHNSTLVAGINSTLKAGNGGTLTAGSDSVLEAGCCSILRAGVRSELIAGDDSLLVVYGCDGVFVNMGEDKIRCMLKFRGKEHEVRIPHGRFRLTVKSDEFIVREEEQNVFKREEL